MRQLALALTLAAIIPLGIGLAVTTARSTPPEKASLEPGEQYPGGKATTHKSPSHRDVFSQSSANIGFEGEANFKIGNAIFRKLWVSSPASTKSSDGLGPIFNARACQNCHLKDGRGHPPSANAPDDDAVSMFLRLSIPPKRTPKRKPSQSTEQMSFPNQPTVDNCRISQFRVSITKAICTSHMKTYRLPWPMEQPSL